MTRIDRWSALRCASGFAPGLLLALAVQHWAVAQDLRTAPPSNTAMTTALPDAVNSNVPRLMKFSGVVADPDGKPATGIVAVTFNFYKEQEGAALWTETQNLQLDAQGRYTVLLGAGSAAGLPIDLFASGNALWLGVQPELAGQSELPRVLLVAVPYALKAADADTLGGKPASAYALSQGQATPSSGLANGNLSVAQRNALQTENFRGDHDDHGRSVRGHGMNDFIPIWTGDDSLGDSILFQTLDNVGAGTRTPGAKLDAVSSGIAVRGTSSGAGQSGVVGVSNATTGYGSGVSGTSASVNGAGVAGYATATSNNGSGVYGQNSSGSGAGVVGVNSATTGYANGVYGQTVSTSGNGLSGFANAASGYTAGVYGYSASTNGSGVYGDSPNNVGVGGMGGTLGVWGDTVSTSGSGVAGYADATSGYTNGVFGQSASTNGNGVSGNAIATTGNAYGVNGSTFTTGFGAGVAGAAWATTGTAFGVFGQTASNNAPGIFGYASSTSGTPVGVVGFVESPNAVAGQFVAHSGSGLILQGLSGSATTQVFTVDANGNLDISGNLTVSGSKSARVKLQDGRDVALYAVESPENWFEDFGTAQLQAGAVQVSLDPGFLQTIDSTANYHVFLTPKGDCHGLYVASTTSAGFVVRELGSGSSSVAFDYRIVAHRRGFETIRLQEVKVPKGPTDMQAKIAGIKSAAHSIAPPRITAPAMSHPAPPVH
ncbi:autotransporter outer membrane beta-barrel domain-containing protein [Acidicapsa acidisoli]|uniref:hypothetical protein n=1 Tax=Acidicapsa acidisoli TaxID=1615681 RepID=UPI0021E0D9AE|nr:hypothetical protein [Acidicapsa acidisoli]